MSRAAQIIQIRQLIQDHHLGEARSLLNGLFREFDDDVEIWHLQATVSGLQGHFEESASWSRKIISLHPGQVETWRNLGNALVNIGDISEAAQAYSQVVRLLPDDLNVRLELASLYRQSNQTAMALDTYQQAIVHSPSTAELHYNLGTLHQEIEQLEEAQACFLEALRLKPDFIQAGNNLGLVYQEQGRLDEALEAFNRALTGTGLWEEQALAEVHRHRALLWLLQGNMRDGWNEYSWRHTDPEAVSRPFTYPHWDGSSSLASKTILIVAEQGVGDEIMFASCVSDLVEIAECVVLDCNPRLAPLFERSFKGVIVCGNDMSKGEAGLPVGVDIDVMMYAGSLPQAMRLCAADYHRKPFYLSVDSQALHKWQQRYAKLGSGLKVGISWRGGTAAKRKKRSTNLTQWLPVLKQEDVCFINLQYGDCSAELNQLFHQQGVQVFDWPDADPLVNLDDFAAQVAVLDLIISIDNATVHIAGALGKAVWIAQPFAPEWRWMTGCDDSYWYHAVRQFRQPRPGHWDAVFNSIGAAFSQLVRDHNE